MYLYIKYISKKPPWLLSLLAAKKAIALLVADQRICFPRFLELIAQLTVSSLLGCQALLGYTGKKNLKCYEYTFHNDTWL